MWLSMSGSEAQGYFPFSLMVNVEAMYIVFMR